MSTARPPGFAGGFDSKSPAYLADPGAALAEARSSCPVFRDEATDIWLVTRYEDVRRVLMDHESFSAKTLRTPVVPPPEFGERLPQHDLFATTVLILDPPEHTRVRKLMNKTFTAKRMADQGPIVSRIADQAIDGFIDEGRCDLMNEYTEPVLWKAIVAMFGIPESEIGRLQELREDLFALLQDTNRGESVTGLKNEVWSRIADGYDYFRPILEERRANPQDDMTTVLLEATDDEGKPAFTDDEIVMHVMGTVASSTDTTSILICNTVLLLDENPDVAAAVRADPRRLLAAIDESLRRYAPAVAQTRVATHDVEIAGASIPAGAMVGAVLPSANHDEEHFTDPQGFDIDRDNAHEQLAFGAGRHFCLGAPLARFGARAALETLYRRIPELRVPEQEYEWTLGLSRQYKSLIVEWD
jgi:cytochrome P450